MAQSLAQLRAEAQQRSNQENKTLVSTAEWNRYINEAITELYDKIVSSFPTYYLSSYSFTLTSTNIVALASAVPTFYKVKALDFSYATSERPMDVRELNFQERNRFSTLNYAGQYVLWYTPGPPSLSGDSDELDFIMDKWSEYVVLTAAIAGTNKEESSIDGLLTLKGVQSARIDAAVPNRSGEPAQAADMTFGGRDSGRRYYLSGSNLVVVGSTDGLWAF